MVAIQNDFGKVDFSKVVGAFHTLAGVLPTLDPLIKTIKDDLKKLGTLDDTNKSLTTLGKTFTDFGNMIGTLKAVVHTSAGTNIPFDFAVLGQTARQIATGLRSVWSQIQSDANSKWSSITGSIKKVESDFITPLQDLIKKVKTIAKTLSSAWDQIKSDLSTKWTAITALVKGLPSQLTPPFAKLITTMKKIGSTMMAGLAAGISANQNAAVNAATKAAAAAVTAVKNHTTTKSPSLVFSRIGEDWMLGEAMGINKRAGTVRDAAVAAALGSVNAARSTSLSGSLGNGLPSVAPTIPSAAAAPSGGTVIEIHLQSDMLIDGMKAAQALAEPIRIVTMRGKGRQTGNIYGGSAGRILPTGS
jgi:hypothetical protein